ncbi:unnamed protein product [Litomosoides sigmodontis]|uniref:Uncharacterized protein n=1 Tax=Litomosoides sigmodontis TaxID=42156 RepID=A0A3P6SQ97_LITSI|nr:unnamed protein product [Litomosoides sigmodontis]
MAQTSKADDGDDLVTPLHSSSINDEPNITTKMGSNCSDESIPNQNRKEMDEMKEKDELEMRRKREAALSEEELNSLREDSKTLKAEGNDYFGQGFWCEAVRSYTKSLDTCPLIYTHDRATYLSNRAAAYIKLRDWEKAIEDCNGALEIGAPNDKPLERRAHCCSQLEEKYEQAIEDYASLQKMYPERRNEYAKKIAELKGAIDERNERMKREVISKLKDFGNMCLKPFGLSTDNFEMVQQPGGGYSINMKKK